jgi:hypothetical protein
MEGEEVLSDTRYDYPPYKAKDEDGGCIVEIPEGSGNLYRYEYEPFHGKTIYRGPVGSAPALTEDEFLDELYQVPEKSTFIEENVAITEEFLEDANEEMDDAQFEVEQKPSGKVEVTLVDDEGDSKVLKEGTSITTKTFSEGIVAGVESHVEHGVGRPIELDIEATVVEITSEGRKQPGGKGKGAPRKLASKVRKALAKEGAMNILQLTKIVDDNDTEKVSVMVEELVEKGELTIIN